MKLVMILNVIVYPVVVRAIPVVEHPPERIGRSTSDESFINRELLGSQVLADDFALPHDFIVQNVVWWGDYASDTTPPTSGAFRMRLYTADSSAGLPNDLYFETIMSEPLRLPIYLDVAGQYEFAYYMFQETFAVPIFLRGNTFYWIEIAEIDNPSSTFLWQWSRAERNGFAYSNSVETNWQRAALDVDLAYRLSIPEPRSLMLLLALSVFVTQKRSRHLPATTSVRTARKQCFDGSLEFEFFFRASHCCAHDLFELRTKPALGQNLSPRRH
jgi:hypothetical protein